ncbi:hypothetical protein E4P41_21685 [Geodermatophilus sp. DF01-2]|uniref:hypothetical protein n=1 Tax=Geodermatophilus sp. DF01-2 TaxID=2559610 RepID=UPI0010732B95|nr:hypothetical protein [Geodermatophilus sp. DF01_2]TFV52164.1 hypothetical protein E4P41_21685 [Geodermatophilus sp. DF01_2]
MRTQITSPVRRLLGALSGAGPRVDDAVRTAAEVVAAGCSVALVHTPAADAADPAGELRDLVARVAGAGLAGRCELTVPVDRPFRAGDHRRREDRRGAAVRPGPPRR